MSIWREYKSNSPLRVSSVPNVFYSGFQVHTNLLVLLRKFNIVRFHNEWI